MNVGVGSQACVHYQMIQDSETQSKNSSDWASLFKMIKEIGCKYKVLQLGVKNSQFHMCVDGA